jgi:uncharacterized protein (UPF0264 family)
VSVRNLTEARSALRGGADIIDIKEPFRGSLGRADAQVIRQIVGEFSDASSAPPLSAALGEVMDASETDQMHLPGGLSLAKLGLSGLGRQANWAAKWLDVRQACEDVSAATAPRWVAVAYADAEAAGAPPVEEVLEAASRTRCAGLLIDTFHKNEGRLLDLISLPVLTAMATAARQHGLFFAVAGQIQTDDVALIQPVRPDIIAVRSAACEKGDRQAAICPRKIQEVKAAIRESQTELTSRTHPRSLQPGDEPRGLRP